MSDVMRIATALLLAGGLFAAGCSSKAPVTASAPSEAMTTPQTHSATDPASAGDSEANGKVHHVLEPGLVRTAVAYAEDPYVQTYYQPITLPSGVTVYPVETNWAGSRSFSFEAIRDGWVWLYGSKDGDEPAKLFGAPRKAEPVTLQIGDSFEVAGAIVKAEAVDSVTVGGKDYPQAIRATSYSPDGKVKDNRYYVLGVGLVLIKRADGWPLYELMDVQRKEPAPVYSESIR